MSIQKERNLTLSTRSERFVLKNLSSQNQLLFLLALIIQHEVIDESMKKTDYGSFNTEKYS